MATTLSPNALKDPHKLHEDLKALRAQRDIPYSTSLQAYVVSRYTDILTVLDKPDVFSSKPTVPEPPEFIASQIRSKCPLRGTLLGLDNPDHDRLRRSVSSFFVPRRLQRFEPMIERLANELLDGFVAKGNVNIKSEFALPLPLKVVSTIVGLDPARWRWTGESLALFGGHEELSTGTFEDKVHAILKFHEHVARLIEARRTDRRDDLISHIWNERDAGNVAMTDFEHLSMIPGLLLAGHETTTNLLSMGLYHLLHNGFWQQINSDDETRAAAIEELLRFESAITGMRREVTQDFRLGNLDLKAGDQIFCAYNSASRDSDIFPNADQIIPNRKFRNQHLGFGRGVHACLGAPLARLLLRIEVRTLYKRLPELHLVEPYDERQYLHVHEGRGVKSLTVAWNSKAAIDSRPPGSQILPLLIPQQAAVGPQFALVESVQHPTPDVAVLDLKPLNQQDLPLWTAGAHVDIAVGDFGFRQYSICSDPEVQDRFSVAVLLEQDGTGGSKFIHSNVHEGQTISIRGPRNHFALRPANSYLLVAGGIGITPIRCMMFATRSRSIPYRVVYLGSSREKMPFWNELSTDPLVTLWPKDKMGRFDLNSLDHFVNDDSLVYCCGPSRLISAMEELYASLPAGMLNVERFTNDAVASNAPAQPFEVLLQRSGRELHVPATRSLIQVLNENGLSIPSTCSKGVCGTCEVGVVEGLVDHRDTVLTREEKSESRTMMPCVSRCVSQRLVLDLW